MSDILVHDCIIADVEIVTETQRRRPEIAGPAGRLVDQFLLVGRIRFESQGFLPAGHIHRGRVLQEAPHLIRTDDLFFGVNFLCDLSFFGFKGLTGFGA